MNRILMAGFTRTLKDLALQRVSTPYAILKNMDLQGININFEELMKTAMNHLLASVAASA